MGKLEDLISVAKEQLKTLVTADNTDAIAKMSKALDDVSEQGSKIENESISLKDKIVDMVKGGLSSQKPPKDDIESEDTNKSLDDIMKEEEQKIIARRK